MPQITDPVVQAQLEIDMRSGNVPRFSTTDVEQAQAFVDYFNTLTGSTAMELVVHTTYSYKIINPEE